ncbi:MAG: hypothetical protein M1828_002109 [Chrysothrix sp. TS-e1954]|nr:MAG: hypothetical protein M1828_002109 [Chrysothrix sp. TS-e1954]
MSRRHLFNNPDGLVAKGLRGAVSYNPALALIEESKVVYDTTHPSTQVSVISGGGAGHEPAWAGYVGEKMLAASASGDIFASPSTKQILAAVEAVPSTKGTILVVTNYTGDCLHFGLACDKANATNKSPCGIIICGDDVSVGKKGSLVGRRGLAAQIGVLKIMGAASAAGASFDELMSLGTAVERQIVSIAATLDHCHVPGRAEHAMLKDDEIELGTGPHNEPGYTKLSPVPSPEDFIGMILRNCLDESDSERGYVHFEKDDTVILMVSNFGGVSQMELGAIVDEVLIQLERDWSMVPVRVYAGPLETSLNAPAFSTSVVNLTAASKQTSYSVNQILEFLDVRTNTQWECMAGSQAKRRPRKEQFVKAAAEAKKTVDSTRDLKVDPTLLTKSLRTACEALSAAEPDLTKWDTIMGDGDCGETLKTGATSLLNSIDKDSLTSSGSIVAVLHELENIVESKMGGTLGGILGIFFVSLTNALQNGVSKGAGQDPVRLWASALETALASLGRYTPAKVGDRTVMDVLIPFAEVLKKEGSFEKAVKEAERAAEGTKKLTPRLGRATYVGGGSDGGKDLPPDPGAWGIMVALRGLWEGMSG